MNDNSTNSAISDDLLFGASKIAEFLFGDMKHRRKIYYLTNEATNGIPHFKIGQTTCASKRAILRWIAQQEEQQLRWSHPELVRSSVGAGLRSVMDKILRTIRSVKR